jgi:hypothetical protein
LLYCLLPCFRCCLFCIMTPLLKHILCLGEFLVIYIIHLLLKKKCVHVFIYIVILARDHRLESICLSQHNYILSFHILFINCSYNLVVS